MAYKLIEVPVNKAFAAQSKAELKLYNRWFHENIQFRIEELEKLARETPGFEAWRPDFTPNSLEKLGELFARNVQTRERTNREIKEIELQTDFPIDIQKWELSTKTVSIAIDVGMYLGQVF